MERLAAIEDPSYGVVVRRQGERSLDRDLELRDPRWLDPGIVHLGRETQLEFGVAQCVELHRQGRITSVLPTWEVPPIATDGCRPLEHAVRHMAQHDNGLIHVENTQSLVQLCGDLVRAYALRGMIFLVPRREDIEPVRRAIKRWASAPVKALASDSDFDQASRHFVGVVADLEHVAGRLRRDIDLVVCFDARKAAQFSGRESIGAACRAKLFGGVLRGQQLDWLDERNVRIRFGFQDVHILRNGLAPRTVQLQLVRFCQRQPSLNRLPIAERLMEGITANPARNTRVATAARGLARTIETLGSPRLAIIAAHLSHAVNLQLLLPDWPILADGLSDRPHGFRGRDWERVHKAHCRSGNQPGRVILSLDQYRRLEFSRFDGIVMASGTNGVAPRLLQRLQEQVACSGPCRLIDFTDEHGRIFRKRAEQRHADYLAAGFGGTGQVSAEELAGDYQRRLEARR